MCSNVSLNTRSDIHVSRWKYGNVDEFRYNVCFMNSAYSVFAYGTLQIPEVMQRVVGVDAPSRPARLNGYQRYKIKNRTYPAIIKSPNEFSDGIIYDGLGDHALVSLDQFEDILYDRCLVDIENETQQAFVYVIKDEYKHLLADEAWSLEEFERKYLKKYLRDISSW
jgi:gamma-glutamylcyclotransferase (GGCT)/AIG2-like uncharacterized protein YtfP